MRLFTGSLRCALTLAWRTGGRTGDPCTCMCVCVFVVVFVSCVLEGAMLKSVGEEERRERSNQCAIPTTNLHGITHRRRSPRVVEVPAGRPSAPQ